MFPKTVTHAKIQPICLPPNKRFEDENRRGGVTFLGYHIIDQIQVLQWVLDWRHNPDAEQTELVQISSKIVQAKLFINSPVNWILDFLKLLFHPVHRCNLSFKSNPGEKPQTFVDLKDKNCISGGHSKRSPGMGHEPCRRFHKEKYRYVSSAQIKSHFNQPNLVSEFQRGSLDSPRKRKEIR